MSPGTPAEVSGPFLPYFTEHNLERVCSERCFPRFLSSHLDTLPSRGTDNDGRNCFSIQVRRVRKIPA